MKIAVFSLLVVLSSFDIAEGNGMHNIHWNATNPLFNPRVSENIIQVNGGNHPSEYDQVNIVCPFYKSIEEAKNAEKYIIYSVTQQEHDSCRISEANPRIIAVCDRPHELMYFTITFRSFTPTPGGLEFRPGHSYYFISTSSRNDIHRRVGGGCSTHNMKITFKVAQAKQKSSSSTARSKPIFTIEENNHLDLDGEAGATGLSPFSKLLQKNKKKKSTIENPRPRATLYYPLHEIAQMKEFFYKRTQERSEGSSVTDEGGSAGSLQGHAAGNWQHLTKMQGDDPRIASSSSKLTIGYSGWEMNLILLLIMLIRANTL